MKRQLLFHDLPDSLVGRRVRVSCCPRCQRRDATVEADSRLRCACGRIRGQLSRATAKRLARISGYVGALEVVELRSRPVPMPGCVSGLYDADGDIGTAIRARQRRDLENAVRRDRKRRTPEQLRAQYDAAMAEKRSRS